MNFPIIMIMKSPIFNLKMGIRLLPRKDAVKLLPLLKQNPDFKREIWVVPVEAVLSPWLL